MHHSSLTFLKTAPNDWTPGTTKLLEVLRAALNEQNHVLWLVCGGSNIPASKSVMEQLSQEESARLVIMLTDERFGPVGHPDSNAWQLMDSGFPIKQAEFIPCLQAGLDLLQTVNHYGSTLDEQLTKADVCIAQFGIGLDGHIGGILPGSLATTAHGPAAGYETEQYTRITASFSLMRRISIAVAMAFGDAKKEALQMLHDSEIDLVDQPSQILKQIPVSFLFNDQIGDTV